MKIIYFLLLSSFIFYSQVRVEYLGLKDKSITTLRINYGITAVGTDGNGVYWSGYETPDSVIWNHIPLQGKNIRTVYPHKSGPLGWAIGAGIRPEIGDTNFVYCSYLGGDFKSISSGIDPEYTYEISDLDGSKGQGDFATGRRCMDAGGGRDPRFLESLPSGPGGGGVHVSVDHPGKRRGRAVDRRRPS